MSTDNGGQAVHGAHGVPGLRERKKLATRQALSAAAMRLALEQGFDNLRVEDIAEAAGVSPRTFNNYFSSREDAIVAARTAQIERMAQALLERPAEESLLEAIGNAMTGEQDQPREQTRDVIRLFLCNPTLHGAFLRNTAQTSSPMIEAVAQRTGTSTDDLLPNVVTSAALGAMRAAMQKWLSDEESPPFKALLRDALNQLRALADTPEASAPEKAHRGNHASTASDMTTATTTATTATTVTATTATTADSAVGEPAPAAESSTATADVSAVSAASAQRAIISGRAA